MTDRLSNRILSHIADRRYRPQQTRQLAEALGIDTDEYDAFARTVGRLIDAGQMVLGDANTIALPPPGRQMTGSFRRHERGFGFVVPDVDKRTAHGDLFIPAGNTAGAMTGDRVRADVMHRPARGGSGRSPYVGRIEQIIQRADKHYVGNLFHRGGLWLVQVDSGVLSDPVVVGDPHAKGAAEGDKVVVELVRYPVENELAQGVILEVLGEKGKPDVETLAVMRTFGLSDQFPDAVLPEARSAAAAFDEKTVPSDRQDLTDMFICTIDPPDAKDYDDAISIRRTTDPQDGYELGIHIADVSCFVTPGSELDKCAEERGNSTYLPRKVVPMLPELLSNGVCSLQEGVIRYCKSAFITYDRDANVVDRRLANTVIRSARRLTYLEAQALIDGDRKQARKHAASGTEYPEPLVATLKLMDELAKLIRSRRLGQGMIELALPEVALIYDDAGHVVDAEPEDDAFTHKIIEMFMVEANEAVASLFDSLDVPLLRRIHPDPDSHNVNELRQFARVAGYNIPARPGRRELQQLLDTVRGTPAQQAVHFAVLKTLSKAEYAPLLIGHFALASEHYAHFTSPIRRYPDLLVHRAIDAYLDHYADSRKRFVPARKKRGRLTADMAADARCPGEDELAELGRHCSATERNSEAAERDLREYLVLDMLAKHVGEDFAGTVTGITSQGVFVQVDRYVIDGFIRATDLPGAGSTSGGERWRLNTATGALVAQRSGKSITIGDTFTVRLVRVEPDARRMDLMIVDTRPPGRKKKRRASTSRKGRQQTVKLKRLKRGKPKRR